MRAVADNDPTIGIMQLSFDFLACQTENYSWRGGLRPNLRLGTELGTKQNCPHTEKAANWPLHNCNVVIAKL
jgi:hypothetical protein